jgi:hypothetical protein
MNEGYDIRALLAQMLGGQTPAPSQFTGTVQLPEFQPRQQQPMQQQGQSINPMQAMQVYNQAAPLWGGQPLWGGAGSVGGSAAPVSGSMSGVGTAAQSSSVASGGFGGTAGGSAGGSAGAAGGSWGSAAASAAPWAVLAAAIIANESKQRGDGNRGNSGWEHAGDLLTGKVLERDADRYLAHNKAGGATKRAMMMSTPSGAVRNVKDFGSWLGGLFN